MGVARSRARFVAALALASQVMVMTIATIVLACDRGGVAVHAQSMDAGHDGMVDCPMKRQSRPVCPKHQDRHGTQDCDCPTLGCSQADLAMTGLLSVVGDLPQLADLRVDWDVEQLSAVGEASANIGTRPPDPPPPRG
jgi:hypothetical protein